METMPTSWLDEASGAGNPDEQNYPVRGSIPDTSAALDSRIYFDQNGVLSKRFGLTAVPARITPAPSGERLNIETFL
uniref:Uncharacterized protein n=1 Tax=Klebsiella pneumoniae TaxID=573 RepID=A0A2P1BNX7_KLEPN|nr:hypothetical protein [Klebsiella pneumoniae]